MTTYCWVKLSLINLPSINCQPGYVNFELLHRMCGQSSFNAHADSNLVYSQTRNKNAIDGTITVLNDQC